MAFAVVAYLHTGCRIHAFVAPAPRQSVTVQDKRFTAAIHYAIYDQLSLSQGVQKNRKPFKLDLALCMHLHHFLRHCIWPFPNAYHIMNIIS